MLEKQQFDIKERTFTTPPNKKKIKEKGLMSCIMPGTDVLLCACQECELLTTWFGVL